VVRIPPSPTHRNFGSYLEAELDGCTDPNSMGSRLRAYIVRIISEEIAEM